MTERTGDGEPAGDMHDQPSSRSSEPDAKHFAALLDELPLLVWTCDPEGHCDYVSRRWLDYTGSARAALLGEGWLERIHPEDRRPVHAHWQAALMQGTPWVAKYRLRRHDGVYRWFEAHLTPVRAATGTLLRWTGGASDVHDAHEARAALQASEEKLQGIIATSPGAVLSFRQAPDGSISFPFTSAAAHALYGLSAEEMATDARRLFQHIHPDDIGSVGESIAISEREMKPWRADFRYIHPVMGVKWLAGHSMPVRDADGGITWNGVVVDVSAQKQRELELTTVKSQLDAALNAADMGVYVVDLVQGTAWGNDTLHKLFGFDSVGITTTASQTYPVERWLELVHTEDRARVRTWLEEAATSEERLTFDFRFKRLGDAETRFMSGRMRMVRGADGRPARVVGIAMDVTLQKLAAEAQARSQKREALGTLAGGIAHDFNNVLQAVVGRAALALAELPEGSGARQHVLEIAAAGGHASGLVGRLLSFSRPREQVRAPLDLSSAVNEALKIVRATIPTSISIAATLGENVPATLADATEIQQIVINLATNAAHAIGARQGVIELMLDRVVLNGDVTLPTTDLKPGLYARLTVSDNGSGMEPSVVARIFDPYFTTKAVGEGTGLGLAVVASIMRNLSGSVSVYSQLGKGTTFRLYFPASGPQAIAQTSEAPRAPSRGNGQCVLFVDDEPALAALGKASLMHLGYVPDVFSDSRQALSAYQRAPERYAAVITDLTMPGLSGIELAREVRALRTDLPVIVMSGYAQPEARERAEAAGVAKLVIKPVSLPVLAAALAEVLYPADTNP